RLLFYKHYLQKREPRNPRFEPRKGFFYVVHSVAAFIRGSNRRFRGSKPLFRGSVVVHFFNIKHFNNNNIAFAHI
ncbi:hypothetical protein POH93_28945, partial [Phytobacter diazotrophicus]|uniref:hypothetical protein n=1 Tax=Phytobacter diazotrophicus TaxID=395631 RepID=UPI00232A965B